MMCEKLVGNKIYDSGRLIGLLHGFANPMVALMRLREQSAIDQIRQAQKITRLLYAGEHA
jgi:hypothetical protein